MMIFDFFTRKRFFQGILTFLLAMCVISSADARKLRIVSYNVHHCGGMDKNIDEGRIARIITGFHPDVVAVQELDSVNSRCGNYQLQLLGEKTGMNYTFAKAIDFGGGKYGIGILSKEKPLSVMRIPLPGEEPRVLLICEFKDFYFANMHLSLQKKNQLKSLPLILEQTKLADKPFFIAGDWNSKPHSKFIRKMSEHFTFLSDTTVSTYPSYSPDICIDYIAQLGTESARVTCRNVGKEPVASDHNPIMVSVKWKK